MAWLVGYATEEEKGRLEDRGYVLEDPREIFLAKVPADWIAVCVDNTLFDITCNPDWDKGTGSI